MLRSCTRVAILRVKTQLRNGASLMQMHAPVGQRWYVVPGKEVDAEIAKKVIAEPDVVAGRDGLFPGISQTYRIRSKAAA